MYEIKTDDFYADIEKDIDEWFDTSDYSKDHSGIKKWTNKKVIGMFKDETAAEGEITEFVGLRAKLYSYRTMDKEEKKCKGFHAYRGGINFDWGGVAYDVFIKDIGGPVHHYDDPIVERALTKALGKRIHVERALGSDAPVHANFPKELEMAKTSYPVVSIPFDKTPPSFDPEEIDIYVKPSQKFTIKPRNIFKGVLKHVTQKEAYKWLGGPDMSYYPQQLAFSVWCASSGCGVGMGMLTKYSPMINSLLKFHILFTSRRILSQMNVPLPGDQYFTNMDNKYNKSGYDKACREFDLSKNSDFRYMGAENGGLGRIYVKIFDEALRECLNLQCLLKYLADMSSLKEADHAHIYAEFIQGNWVVNKNAKCRSAQYLGANNALQHINCSMKVSGGLIGITLNQGARAKFFLISPELAMLVD
ncbi:hypothetical protein QZH41_000534 [Actinostola sp. cb2023]|nr:hypothetical protein QZH41_000534 [Actinostola sp. cb2023]